MPASFMRCGEGKFPVIVLHHGGWNLSGLGAYVTSSKDTFFIKGEAQQNQTGFTNVILSCQKED